MKTRSREISAMPSQSQAEEALDICWAWIPKLSDRVTVSLDVVTDISLRPTVAV